MGRPIFGGQCPNKEGIETILGRNIFSNFLGWVVPKSLKTYLPKLGN